MVTLSTYVCKELAYTPKNIDQICYATGFSKLQGTHLEYQNYSPLTTLKARFESKPDVVVCVVLSIPLVYTVS